MNPKKKPTSEVTLTAEEKLRESRVIMFDMTQHPDLFRIQSDLQYNRKGDVVRKPIRKRKPKST